METIVATGKGLAMTGTGVGWMDGYGLDSVGRSELAGGWMDGMDMDGGPRPESLSISSVSWMITGWFGSSLGLGGWCG